MSASTYSIQGVMLLAALAQLAPAMAEDTNAGDDQAPVCKYCPDYAGHWGWLEGGVGYQHDDAYRFGRYTGLESKGALANGAGEFTYRAEDGAYVEGSAQDLGLESRHVQVEGGRQGTYSVQFEYDQLPNFREDSAYSPFRDVGGGRLDLPANWVSGATTADMPNLATDLIATPLKTERNRVSGKFSLLPQKGVEVTGFIRHEVKDGVRDQGATIGFTQTAILPVPFSYRTDDFGITLGYNCERFQSQFSYTGSLFKNEQTATIWRNPYEDASSNTAWGRMAESPDNQFQQLSAILGYQLSDDTRIGARLARGRMTQNEAFVPFTINPAIATTALPATSLDGKVDTTLLSVNVDSRPMPKLRLDASYTFSQRDNNSSVNVYDYVVTDLAMGGSRQNRPYSFEQRLLRLKARYRLPKSMQLSAGFDDDEMHRSYVQAEKTREQTVWTKLKFRPMDNVEGSLKYAYSDRSASPYVPLSSIDPLLDNPNANFYDNPLMRVLHLADRTRDKVGFELSFSPLQSLTLGLDLDYVNDDYNSTYLGMQQATGLTYTGSLSYAFSDTLSGSAFYTYDRMKSKQKGSEKLLYSQPDTLWIASDSYLTESIGLGAAWKAIPDKLELGLDVAYSEFTGNMDFAGSSSLPEIGSTLSTVNLHGTYQLKDNLSLRVDYRYEDYQENDWTKDGVVNAMPSLLSLGTAPQNYTTYVAFLSLRYAFRNDEEM